ncbi:MAG: flagellar biosynthetic protein FliO [Methylotenera sp.]
MLAELINLFLDYQVGEFLVTNKSIPYKTSQTPMQEYGSNEIVVVLLFFILALAVYFYLKKKGPSQFDFVKNKRIKIIERTRVTARASILLIQYNDQYFLLSQSADNITLITKVEA